MSTLVEFHLKITYFFEIFGGLAHLCRIIKYLWHPISKPEYVINSKVTVVLKSTDQGLSILGLISLLKWCLVWWNSIWKLLFSRYFWCVCASWQNHKISFTAHFYTWICPKLKVKVVLKSTDQGLSIPLLKWCLVWWNFIWINFLLLKFLVFLRILSIIFDSPFQSLNMS